MVQDKKSSSQLQAIIEKYQKELLASHGRRTLPETEHTVGTADIQSAPPPDLAPPVSVIIKKDDTAVDYSAPTATQDPPKEDIPAVEIDLEEEYTPASKELPDIKTEDDLEGDCTSPSMYRPDETLLAMTKTNLEEEYTPASKEVLDIKTEDDLEGDCIPPSMYRPDETLLTKTDLVEEYAPIIKEPPEINTMENLEGDCPALATTLNDENLQAASSIIKDCPSFNADYHYPLSPESSTASLHVRVTTGRQAEPVSGARVTVTRAGVSTQRVHKIVQTDKSGYTPVISIPSCNPPVPYTIEVSSNGFCSARYSGIYLYGGGPAEQEIDLIPLPADRKAVLILFD